jgi:hypothetical protein
MICELFCGRTEKHWKRRRKQGDRLTTFIQRNLHVERKQNIPRFYQVWIRQKVLTELKLLTLQIDCPVLGLSIHFRCSCLFMFSRLPYPRRKKNESARKAKAEAYPRKDSSGRLLNESFCVPFILTSMGGLCRVHDFLRLCKKRNKSATLRLLDVLVTQHAKWTARRIRRSLFGQSLVDFSGSNWSCIKLHKSVSERQPVSTQ